MKNGLSGASLVRALPLATSAAIIGLMVACGQSGGGGSAKVTSNPPSNTKAEAEQAIHALLGAKYKCEEAQNIALAKRLEGASLRIDATGQTVPVGAESLAANASAPAANSKLFNATLDILLKGETDDSPAIEIVATGPVAYSPQAAQAGASQVQLAETKSPDQSGEKSADAPEDKSGDKSVEKTADVSGRVKPAIRRASGSMRFLPLDNTHSSAGVEFQYRVQVLCADADCMKVVVQLLHLDNRVGDVTTVNVKAAADAADVKEAPQSNVPMKKIRERAALYFAKKSANEVYTLLAAPGGDSKKCVLDGKVATTPVARKARTDKGAPILPPAVKPAQDGTVPTAEAAKNQPPTVPTTTADTNKGDGDAAAAKEADTKNAADTEQAKAGK